MASEEGQIDHRGEGAPDGDPAAAGEPGEIPFRRQPVSRHVFAGQQAVDDPHPDLFGQISGTDGTPPVFRGSIR